MIVQLSNTEIAFLQNILAEHFKIFQNSTYGKATSEQKITLVTIGNILNKLDHAIDELQ